MRDGPGNSGEVVWRPDQATLDNSRTVAFLQQSGLRSHEELFERSVHDPDWFWRAVVEFLGIPFIEPFGQVSDDSAGKPWTTWFPGGRINLSAVCLDRFARTQPDKLALIAEREEVGEPRSFTFAELTDQVARLAGALATLGVRARDAVVGFLPMSAEAVMVFLATARLGAMFVPIFSGFGAEAVAARLLDPRPAVLVTADGFIRRGKPVRMKEVADAAVATAGGIPALLVVNYADPTDTPMLAGRDRWWSDLVADAPPVDPAATAAEDPVLLAYTSGTTGRPKAAVHVHGGLSVKLAAEGAFQFDLSPADTLMWATDMGWIMGPWMVVAGLGNGAAIATFDGAPDHPTAERLWSLVGTLGITVLGVSPTLIRTLAAHGNSVGRRDLSGLRLFGSTGEPWNPDPWWWLFRNVGGERIPIVNISGGTEIGACILSTNLLQGLKPTSLGSPALGMDADVFDSSGRPVRGEVGELVVKNVWPGMTRGFLTEPERYVDTYWARFPDVWVHGDWASIDADGFWYLHGRSDDTLNIAGKRMGPAEFESAAVSVPGVTMAAAVGVPDELKGEALVLYVVAPGGGADLGLAVAKRVGEVLGKSFLPKLVVVVHDLPRTRSAKIMRRVVKALALGEDPGDLSAPETPSSLAGIEPLQGRA